MRSQCEAKKEELAENGRDAGTFAIDDESSHTFVRLGIRVRHGEHKVPVGDSTVRDPALGSKQKDVSRACGRSSDLQHTFDPLSTCTEKRDISFHSEMKSAAQN